MIRIIHTADNHLGIKYSSWNNERAAKAAYEERFTALNRIVDYSNKVNANYLVIAGDLFDAVKPPKSVVKAASDILITSEAPVVIIPGNHDFSEGADSKLWKQFRELAGTANIHLLDKFTTKKIESGNINVIFYPCYCQAKTAEENNLAWVERSAEQADAHIGIAHGNVAGLGQGDNYFKMTKEQLLAKNLDLWLLGHIHVPYPDRASFSGEKILMPGTHTPDGFDRTREGGFFDIQFEDPGNISVSFQKSGRLTFRKLKVKLNYPGDIQQLKHELSQFTPDKTLLNLEISGRLNAEELDDLNTLTDELREKYLFFELNNTIIKKVETADINRAFPENSLPFTVLQQLAGEGSEGVEALALEKGFELFKRHQK